LVNQFTNLPFLKTNSSATNPKQIVISFNRTVQALQIGIGENNGGNFSNVKISLLGSGGYTRSLYDGSADSTKRTSLNVQFENELFNSIRIEFMTVDTVSLSNITIQKARYNTTQIQGKTPQGTFEVVNLSTLGNLLVSLAEQKDAFGRLKIAEPYTIFDNSLCHQDSDALFWSTLTNGGGTSVYDRNTSKNTISTSATGDYVVRQTKQRFKYQPAKSHEFFMTGLLATEAGQRKRVGLCDYDNIGLANITNAPQNGVFFENNAGVISWNIVNNGVVTESVTQENWNIDKCDGTGFSRFELNLDYTNIFTGQLEWLGVGSVAVGFANKNGDVIYCHCFYHPSTSPFVDIYMRTANLPVSYEITSLNGSGSLKQICTSIISGGGYNPVGLQRTVKNSTDVSIGNNEKELVLGIRLKEDNFDSTVVMSSISIVSRAKNDFEALVCINPTYSGTVTWVDVPNSSVQYAVNNNNDVTDEGIEVYADKISGNINVLTTTIPSALTIGKDLQGNRDELWIVAKSEDGADTYSATLNFKDLI